MNPELLEAARKGDDRAIASLLEGAFDAPVNVRVEIENSFLRVLLVGDPVPERAATLTALRQTLEALALPQIPTVKVYAKNRGDEFPAWDGEFSLAAGETPTRDRRQKSSWLGSVVGAVGTAAAKVGETAKEVAERTGETAKGLAERTGETAKDVAGRTGEFLGDAAERATDLASPLGTAAERAGEAVGGALGMTAGAAKGAVRVAGNAAKGASQGTGRLLETINNTPGLKQLAKAFKADWLVALLGQVDVAKAQSAVEELRQQYPQENPRALARRLMMQKAMLAGGSGLATSLLPGVATSLLAVDLASTTLLQAEMLYQIAGLYGMDLQDPERRTEVLAIFGLSLGGNRAVSLGLSAFARNIPLAGAVIGAGSNAAMIYALGYGACRFYEVKLDARKSLPEELEAMTVEGERYLEDAIAQEAAMDRILVYLIRAGNPERSRDEILAGLQAANLPPTSFEAIAASLDAPPNFEDLEQLLERVNPDFAVPLLAQCQKIARLNGDISPAEAQIIATVKQKLDSEKTRALGLTGENEGS